MIEYVFLDLDDTILDFHLAEHTALAATLESLGIPPCEETLARYSEINRACWERLERGELTRHQVLHTRFDILFSELSVDCDSATAQREYEHRLSLEHPFMDGGREVLDALYGRYKLYITSNGTAVVQDRRIAESGIARYFDKIFISQRVGCDKPSREFFNRVFAAIDGFDKSRAIILGDSLTSDILGGLNAGILTCYFNPKGRENKSGIKPHYEISSLSQFTRLLEEI